MDRPGRGKITAAPAGGRAAEGLPPDTRGPRRCASTCDLHILPALGDHPLGQLSQRPSLIQQCLCRAAARAGRAGQVFITLSAVLYAAADDGLIARNPCKAESIAAAGQARRKVDPVDRGRGRRGARRAAAAVAGVVDCGAGLGLRQGEILGTGPDEIDFLRRRFHVRPPGQADGRPGMVRRAEGRPGT